MKTTIIRNAKIWIWITIWISFFVVVLIINFYFLNQNRYLLLTAIVCLIAPLVFFEKLLKRKYIEEVEIRLDCNSWAFYINMRGIEKKYKLNDVRSYGITESTNGYSSRISFNLKCKSPKSFNLTMYNKEQNEDETKTEQILEAFQSLINNFNDTVSESEKILLAQTFEESIYGLVSIYILSCLLFLAVTFHIVYGQWSTLPLSLLFGGGLLIRMIIVRQRDIRRRKRIRREY